METARKLVHNDVSPDWVHRLQALLPAFAERASAHDRDGSFVQQNYADLKAARFFSAGIPQELGGGGVDYATLADFITQMAQACGSTALAFVMHTHPVLLNVYKFKNAQDAKARATLSKIAASELVIVGTGANDWLQSNGRAEPVEAGYRVTAHKRFVSGCPGAQVLVTSAVTTTLTGDQVLHFSVPLAAPGITVLNNWDTLGMRGSGSQDVVLRDVFVPDDAVVARRPVRTSRNQRVNWAPCVISCAWRVWCVIRWWSSATILVLHPVSTIQTPFWRTKHWLPTPFSRWWRKRRIWWGALAFSGITHWNAFSVMSEPHIFTRYRKHSRYRSVAGLRWG